MSLIHDLRDLAASIRTDEQKTGFFVWNDVPFNDFNRQIIEPGDDAAFPSGLLNIYGDEDYYIVASLPYRFKELSCADIIPILWPEIENPIFLPDHGDYWWTAKANHNLEVPGEPWELWFFEDNNSHRWSTCETEEKALKARSNIGGSVYKEDFDKLSVEIRCWEKGIRRTIHKIGLDPEKFNLIEKPDEPCIYKHLGLSELTEEKETS